jgi:hypothetical protein
MFHNAARLKLKHAQRLVDAEFIQAEKSICPDNPPLRSQGVLRALFIISPQAIEFCA